MLGHHRLHQRGGGVAAGRGSGAAAPFATVEGVVDAFGDAADGGVFADEHGWDADAEAFFEGHGEFHGHE